MNHQSESRAKYTAKRTSKALQYLGGECSSCGSVEKLQFHHLDPKSKEKEISTAIRVECWSWKRLQVELDKCVLLCQSCHQSEHRSKYDHGTPQKYWRGCRCSPCTSANTIHSREYKKSRLASKPCCGKISP